jgi:GDPmannose 4,6-dehydratase
MVKRTALVTGISGQDGAYLARLLLEKGYRVIGAHRRNAGSSPWRLEELGVRADIELVLLDLAEYSNILRLLERARPDEIYNLAAQSFVGASFELPIYTGDVSGLAVARFLEATRTALPDVRFYQASTSEMFGKAQAIPQNEHTPFHPRSPYGVAKLFAHWITVNYREAYGLYAVSGILFNHESPLRGLDFVTRKITAGLAERRHGRAGVLELGNLDAKRDWGFAGDYVEGMWRMLQQPQADDYVLATGSTHTVREFVGWAAEALGQPIEFEGEGPNELGRDVATGEVVVRVSPTFYRPAEVDLLVGDASKARQALEWQPRVDVRALAAMMAEADAVRAARGPILA